jgi:16S rRNA (cytosine967-C5)-methyltransferase
LIPGIAPRSAAWRVLHDLRHGTPLDRALHRALGGLPEADRSLAHEIAAGVLRQRDALDLALNPFLSGGPAGVRPDVLDILRLGAYQLLFLDRVPRHAAVDTAVTLARRFGGAGVGGFVNAVLRNVSRHAGSGDRGLGIGPSRSPDSGVPTTESRCLTTDQLATRYSHPEWLVARWVARLGTGETERLLSANNSRPPLVLQAARWSEDAIIASLDAAGIAWHHAPFDAGIVVSGRNPRELPGFGAGAWYVQDPAQAMVTRYADLGTAGVVLDAAAAPGGKSIALSKMARFLIAADLRPARTRRLRENLSRAGSGPAAVIAADGEHPPVRPCDAVLLDAPCLGTGVFARHPDARWRVSLEGLATLVGHAARLLRALAEVVRPGGLLVFATCSLEPEENELQVEAFLADDSRFVREPPPADTVPADLLTPAGDLALLPQRHATDGAFATRLRRTA